MKHFGAIAIASCLLVVIAGSYAPADVEEIASGSPDATFLDQMATNGLPGLFSELAGAAADAGNAAVGSQVWVSGDLSRSALQSKQIRDKIAAYNQWLGRACASIDLVGKAWSGQYEEALWSGGLTMLGELAGTESGKAALAYCGCATTAPVTAAILAVQVYRSSTTALAEATNATQLESLYGGLENMLRVKGRKRGDGSEPFPVTPENEEKVWKRIISDQGFRDRFKIYVTDVLQREFPEPGFFDSMDAYVADPIISLISGEDDPAEGYAAAAAGAPTTPSTAAQRIERTARNKLESVKGEMMVYIAGLIGQINRMAKAEEARLELVRSLRELQAMFAKQGVGVEEGLKNMEKAERLLPEVTRYSSGCGTLMDKHIAKKSLDSLRAEMAVIRMHVRDCIRWLPTKGPLAASRNEAYGRLRSCYERAYSVVKELEAQRKKEAQNPETPPVEEGGGDPRSYYESYVKPICKPFDWGGHGDPDSLRDGFVAYLKKGQFATPRDRKLPDGRLPLADIIESAWVLQRWDVAFGNPSGVSMPLDPPESKLTIKGFFDLQRYELQQKMNFWQPPDVKAAAEAAEQARQEFERVKQQSGAISDAAKAAGAAYSAAYNRYMKLAQAWSQGAGMGGGVIDDYEALANSLYSETRDWLQAVKGEYTQEALEAWSLYDKIKQDIASLALPDEPSSNGGSQSDPLNLKAAIEEIGDKYSESGFGNIEPLMGGPVGEVFTRHTEKIAAGRLAKTQEMRVLYSEKPYAAYLNADIWEEAADKYDEIMLEANNSRGEICAYCIPDFPNEEIFAKAARRKAMVGEMATKSRSLGEQLERKIEETADNYASDAFFIRRVGRKFEMWIEQIVSAGMQDGGWSYDQVAQLKVPSSNWGTGAIINVPYPHVLTVKEKESFISRRRAEWNSAGIDGFLSEKVSWLKKMVDDYFTALDALQATDTENFIICTSMGSPSIAVTETALAQAERVLPTMVPGDKSFDDGWKAISMSMPLEYQYTPTEGFRDDFKPECMKSPLVPRYTAVRNRLKELMPLHKAKQTEAAARETQRQADEALRDLPGLVEELRRRIADARKMIADSRNIRDTDKPALEKALKAMQAFHTEQLTAEPYSRVTSVCHLVREKNAQLFADSQRVTNDIGLLSGELHQAESQLRQKIASAGDFSAAIAKFYEEFRKAYEYRNDSKVMSMIGDNWSAGDGTTLSDLQGYLRDSFTVFNEIRYDLRNLKIEKITETKFRASYDIYIVGKIYETNIKHEETSSVSEEVTVDGAGRVKITRTLEGRFWYVR